MVTSSNANVLGVPAFTAYAASKAAVRSFARGWTMELKDRKIRVNSMSPGPIETPALEKYKGARAKFVLAMTSEEMAGTSRQLYKV